MSSAISRDVLCAVERISRERCAGHDAAHDALHLARVVANARRLAVDEGIGGQAIDASVVEAAAWLHDVVQLPKGEGPPGESARRSASAAREILTALGVSQDAVDAVAHAVEAHSFSGGLRPETVEAAILQDADRLDALGAIGLARLWVTGAELGSLLYHPEDPAGAARELDDRRFALDHVERKLLKLPGLMNTVAGRREAQQRAAFLREYRATFLHEIGETATMADASSTTTDQTPLDHAIASGAVDAEIIVPGAPTPTVPAAAEALGVSEEQILKSLLFVAPDGSVFLAVATGTTRVDRARLAAYVGVERLKMASPELVQERTGYPAGGVAPVAHATQLRVVVDRRVLALAVAYAGGGRTDAMLRIRPEEIVRLTGAEVADIAE